MAHKICEHNKRKIRCKECKGSQICQHNREKSLCKECGGSQICQHNKQKQHCKECDGSQICEHDRHKSECKECGGSQICEHNKIKSQCKECSGSSFCEHNKRKAYCKECNGSQICEHDKRKSRCIDCNGSEICKHNKQKSRCIECNGSEICEHKKLKQQCIICTPDTKAYCTSCRLFMVNKTTNYLCSYCNPNKTKLRKTKENEVKNWLDENNIKYIQDKSIKNDCCLKYRPYFLIDCNSYFLIVECDEFAHDQYDKDCETIRMNNISIALGLPTRFIRFNPDKKGIKKKEKKLELIKIIKENMNKEYLDNLECIYLFYT